MKRVYFVAFLSILFFSVLYYIMAPGITPAEGVVRQYRKDVKAVELAVDKLFNEVQDQRPLTVLRKTFLESREAYKKVEWLAEYYNSYTAKHINGPALPEVESDEKNVIIQPEGFQVIEEFLFPVYEAHRKDELIAQVNILKSNFGRLRKEAEALETTDAHIFDALRLQVFRIVTLGISGFDSPLANNSIPEASVSLQRIETVLSFYQESLINCDSKSREKIKAIFTRAEAFLRSAPDFNRFDRAAFILDYANPISKYLLALQRELSVPLFTEPRVLSSSAPTLFSDKNFNANFFSPNTNDSSNHSKIKLGRELFNDVKLSGNSKISCATCHRPEKAFTDGLPRSLSFNGRDNLKRNAPTLINASLQAALFYDSRVAYLEDQASEVILNKDEMHGSFEKALAALNKEARYKKLITSTYKERQITAYHLKDAIASYLRSLVMLNSRFDIYMRGNRKALNTGEVNGFNVFMGKAKCGTCHFIPLFNGTVPPLYNKSESEIIGVPATADTVNTFHDADEGKYRLFKIPLHKHSFKTPGLRNVSLTAPYMHNGVFNTLEEVVDFYNRGGGAGLGFKIDHLTLPEDKLHLTGTEKTNLIAFLGALTDTTATIIAHNP